jgi:hypothetical protein
VKKFILQKLAQLIDNLPQGEERKEVMKDCLELKLAEANGQVLAGLKHKYQL